MSVASALAIALLHSVWQVACLAGVAWLLQRWLRPLGPRVSYAIHFTALMLAGLAFIATFASQLWAPSSAGSIGEGVAVYAARSPAALLPLVAVVLWSMGAAFMSVRLLWAWASLQRLRARATSLDGALRERLDRLRAQLGVRRQVELLESPDVDGPITLGWLRPCVLLPVGLVTGLGPEVLEAALAHELAHVGRRDFIANLAQSTVEVVLFHHPATWWLSRQIREQREWCCDDRATRCIVDPLEYARALAELEGFRTQSHPSRRLELAATGGPLMSRIRRLVDPKHRPPASSGVLTPLLASLLALSGVVAGGIACAPAVQGVAEPEPSESAPDEDRDLASPGAPQPSADGGSTVADLPDSLRPYEAQFVDAAREHGVPVRLLAIITMLESRGNPDARSPIGARGLMQLMPATAAQIAAERGIDGHSPEKLDDPAYNIDMGAYYLAQQLRAFDDVELAAAAYNAGPSRVHAHVDEGAALPEETVRYRELVASAWAESSETPRGSP